MSAVSTEHTMPELLQPRVKALAERLGVNEEDALLTAIGLCEIVLNATEKLGGRVFAEIKGERYLLEMHPQGPARM